MALAEYRAGLCPKCGRPLDVCTSQEGVGPDFTAEYTACRATVAIIERQRAISDNGKNDVPYAGAYLWAVNSRR